MTGSSVTKPAFAYYFIVQILSFYARCALLAARDFNIGLPRGHCEDVIVIVRPQYLLIGGHVSGILSLPDWRLANLFISRSQWKIRRGFGFDRGGNLIAR